MNQEEYNKIELKFQENYFKYIKPNLNKFEIKRKQQSKIYKILKSIFLISVLVAFVALITIIIFKKSEISISFAVPAFIISFIFIAITSIITSTMARNFQNEISRTFMPFIVKCFDNLVWSKGYRGDYKEFKNIELISDYIKSNFDDHLEGKYKNTDFEIIEASFYKKSKGETSPYPCFSGVIIKIRNDKPYQAHTVIRPKKSLCPETKALKKTELEDVVFEKKYNVYTDNPIEARVIITPKFMEKLNNIEKVFKSLETYCAFCKNYTYIALGRYGDIFGNFNIEKDLTNSTAFIETFSEIVSIYNLIDYLKLPKNNEIHKKGETL